MTKTNDAYQKIAEMWTFPESQSFRKMLEALLTPEDAALLLVLHEAGRYRRDNLLPHL